MSGPFVLFLAVLLVLAVPGRAAGGGEHLIEFNGIYWESRLVRVQPGDTVTWVNNTDEPTVAIQESGAFNSNPGCERMYDDYHRRDETEECFLSDGERFSWVATEPGFYPYCPRHAGPPCHDLDGGIVVVLDGNGEPRVTEHWLTGADGDDPTQAAGMRVDLWGTPGWVIARLDESGEPGRVVGATSIPEGIMQSPVVTFAEPLEGDQNVWLSLHEDAGEIGVLELDGPDIEAVHWEEGTSQRWRYPDTQRKTIFVRPGYDATPAPAPSSEPSSEAPRPRETSDPEPAPEPTSIIAGEGASPLASEMPTGSGMPPDPEATSSPSEVAAPEPTMPSPPETIDEGDVIAIAVPDDGDGWLWPVAGGGGLAAGAAGLVVWRRRRT